MPRGQTPSGSTTEFQWLYNFKFFLIFSSVLQWGEWSDGVSYSLDKDSQLFGDLSLDIFQEDALMMNSAIILPLVSQYATVNPLLTMPEEGNFNP